MEMHGNMKCGYQGKNDSMRAEAERLLNHPGKVESVIYSKSAADKSKMRPYKKGGLVIKIMKSEKTTKSCKKKK